VSRIFLSLCIAGTVLVAIAFFLGLGIDDPTVRDPAVQQGISRHMLLGLGGLIFAALVHAIVLTYFMGTGRWMEETSRAYKLPADFYAKNQKIKYQLMPGISACILMLVLTGAFGGAADPASAVGFGGWFGFAPSTLHLTIAVLTVLVNLAVSVFEFRSIERNGEIVDQVMNEVNRIRTERGLPV
jgi:hypothetical protein